VDDALAAAATSRATLEEQLYAALLFVNACVQLRSSLARTVAGYHRNKFLLSLSLSTTIVRF
jgi:hypothetical protein